METITQNYTGEIVDLSNMNMFDAAKNIVLISSYNFSNNPKLKIKYKVPSPKIKDMLSEFTPLDMVEIV